ncbi:MAG: nuclear transport factor 2 family protein [Pseudomonadota bacterium]
MNDATSIARASYDAYVRKDRAAIESLIDDDFHFTSPLDDRIDRTSYFERCWPNSQRISHFQFINLVQDGDKVFVTYEGTNVIGGRFRNTEILTVRGQKIVDAEVYFGWSIPHPVESDAARVQTVGESALVQA